MLRKKINTTTDLKEQIQSAFNKAKNTYDENCQLQLLMGEKLIAATKKYQTKSDHIIDLGCGTGMVTAKLAEQISFQEFHAIDFAEQLLGKAYERLSPLRIKIYLADFDYLPYYRNKFDIVFSNMALQWSAQLATTFQSIRTLLKDDGLFVFSLPLPGTFIELQRHFSTYKFTSLNTILKRLNKIGFDMIETTTDTTTLHFPDTLTTLKSIKLVGANFTGIKSTRRLRAKTFLNKLNLNTLTYVIGFFVARKTR